MWREIDAEYKNWPFHHFQKLCAIIGYRSTKYFFSFSKVPVKSRKPNQQSIVLCIKLEHLLNQYWWSFVLIFWCFCLCVSSVFCYLANFWEYRLDNLKFFSVSQLQAWECFQMFTNSVCFHCFAPGFCSKQYNTAYAGDKGKVHSICSTPELSERREILRWAWNYKFKSLLRDIQQAGASKTAGESVIPCFTLVTDYKRLDTRLYFIITNFHTEPKTSGTCQPWHEFFNIYTIYTTISVKRGWAEGGLGPSWHFLIWHFPIVFLAKKILSFEWKT